MRVKAGINVSFPGNRRYPLETLPQRLYPERESPLEIGWNQDPALWVG